MNDFLNWFFGMTEEEKAFYGHAGRPGKRGGSVPASSAMSMTTGRAAVERMQGNKRSKIAAASGGESETVEKFQPKGNGIYQAKDGESPATDAQVKYAKDVIENNMPEKAKTYDQAKSELDSKETFVEAQRYFVGVDGFSSELIGLANKSKSRFEDFDQLENRKIMSKLYNKSNEKVGSWLKSLDPSKMSKSSISSFIDDLKRSSPFKIMLKAHNINPNNITELTDFLNNFLGGGQFSVVDKKGKDAIRFIPLD